MDFTNAIYFYASAGSSGSHGSIIFFDTVIRIVALPYMYLFRAVGLLSFSTDISRVCSERSQVIWEEALKRNIPMEQFVLYDRPIEQYRAYVNGAWRYFGSLPIPPWKNTRPYIWIDNKVMVKRKFLKAGVPVARGGRVHNFRQAVELFETLQKPVIVKPEVGSRGRHSVTHIYTPEDLKFAFKIAQQLCFFVVLEEHLVGSVYRSTYVNGEAFGSLRGDPPRVTGNGVSTIEELINKKNENRSPDVAEYRITDLTNAFLSRNQYTLQTVLENGKTIDLSEKIGLSYGGDAVEDFAITHPKILDSIKKAGDVLGAPLIGFDFIIRDVTLDPGTQKWGILEANAVPFINLHHFPRKGTPVNVAAKVWDMWDKK